MDVYIGNGLIQVETDPEKMVKNVDQATTLSQPLPGRVVDAPPKEDDQDDGLRTFVDGGLI